MVSEIEKTDVHEAFKKIGKKIAERRKSCLLYTSDAADD